RGDSLSSLEKGNSVKIMTPKGIEVSAEILDIDTGDNYVSCAVKKYSGDDPDITDGILIYARAEKIKSGIEITGGEGIGIVTAKGLDQPCGEYAINSVPRKMIAYEVGEILEYYSCGFGIRITISAPEGVEIAKKTYNSRIGIKGGISIIGTSGIVEPMSSKALIDTFRLEMRSRKANGIKNLLLTIGNYSESFLNDKIPDLSEKAVKCSNFIGDAIDSALEYKFQSILIVGHIGKLVKLGAGIMNTHSSQADGRFEVLVTCGVLAGADSGILKKIPECVTTDEAVEIFGNAGILDKVSEILVKKIQYHLNAKVKNSIPIGAVLFSNKYGIIGMTENAEKIAEEYYG
ncbi:MAG: cobalt-precorrin-5B (C(1))-methyltransferase CbiD, partial [Ruminococcus sp.]